MSVPKTLRIGIAGVGGIGSNVAVNLVRSGVEWLKIVDFDRVASSNLNRQFYFSDQIGCLKVEALRENLQRIRPELQLCALNERITAENCQALFADCDVVVEGLDDQAGKKMLVEALSGDSGPRLVSACGIAGSELATIRTRQLGRCTLVGDFVSDCADQPLFAHKVIAIAAWMSGIVLRTLFRDP